MAQYREGQTATMPDGSKLAFKGGRWEPQIAGPAVAPEWGQGARTFPDGTTKMVTPRGSVENLQSIPGSTSEQQSKVADKMATLNTLEESLGEYRKAIGQAPPNVGMILSAGAGPNATRLNGQQNEVLMQLKEAFNLGVLSGPDYELLQKSLTEPVSIGGVMKGKEGLEQQVDQTRGFVDRSRRGLLRAYPAYPAAAAKAGPPMRPSSAAAAAKQLSPADAAKLPAGTRFVGTDGVERVKH